LTEYLRLYISIHGDHEGGNASAHTAREYCQSRVFYLLTFRAQILSAPLFPIPICPIQRLYLLLPGLSTGELGRARAKARVSSGLPSLANQEVLRWQMDMLKEVGDNPTHDQIKEYLWQTLKKGRVVPGWVAHARE
jgi:citrate synthase